MSDEVKEISRLKGTLYYVCLQTPTKAFVKPGTDPKPDEWKATIVLDDEDEVDEFTDYAAAIDAKISIKKYKRDGQFLEKMKAEPPEGTSKYLWAITLRKSTEMGKTGKKVEDKWRPRAFEQQGSNRVDITMTKLVGNGSKGFISIERFDRNNGTSSLYLKNVLVTDLVEYIKPESSGEAGDEFDDVDTPADTYNKKDEFGDTTEAKKPTRTAKKVEKNADDEDAPF